MNNNFQNNLKKLAGKFSQKYIAEKTGFSQSSINNYLTKNSEPSIQFLVALKDAFGICVDDFLFSEYVSDEVVSYEKFLGNYIVYYYNNDSYKGEVHGNIKSTLNYGIISVARRGELTADVVVLGTFMKDRASATKMLKKCNMAKSSSEIEQIMTDGGNVYHGSIRANAQNVFLELGNDENLDQTYIVLNNPPTKAKYIGGVGTVNSISRGREHNPCIQFIILSKNLLDMPDGEIYKCLQFDDYNANLEDTAKDLIDMFKRLYVEKNEIAAELDEGQKLAIIKNKLEYHFEQILEANSFRFAKISNREDDSIYKLIKESVSVE